MCVRSGPGRVRWGTFGRVPTNFGNLPKVRERREAFLQIGFPVLASCQYSWKGGKMCTSPRAEASRDSPMRGARLHLYYTYFGQ